MAITGAFGAGFIQGFGESMQKDAEKRYEDQQRYVDNMMENARRVAPKYAQDNATAAATVDLMNTWNKKYGISSTEFIALAQTHDLGEIQKAIAVAERDLLPGRTLDVKGQILQALNIPEGAKLPDGMTPEQAVTSMVLGYANNVNKNPDDKSETNKNRSWAKAISDVLTLNPRASAEEQIAAMKIAGVPVQQLLEYQASEGSTYKPLQNVTTGKPINFDIGYKDGDYETSVGVYTRRVTSLLTGTDSLDNATNLTEAYNSVKVDNKVGLSKEINKAAIALADLELDLARNNFSKVERDIALERIVSEVNTGSEIKSLKQAVDSGNAWKLVQESLEKHGKLTPEYIKRIINGEAPEGGTKKISAPALLFPNDPMGLPELSQKPLGGPGSDRADYSPSLPKESTTQTITTKETTSGNSLVDKIKSNEKQKTFADTVFEDTGLIAGNAEAVAGRLEDWVAKAQDAASSITYDAYKRMLDTKQGREKLKEMGLPVKGKDRAAAFGILNPEQYFVNTDRSSKAKTKFPKRDEPIKMMEFFATPEGKDLLDYAKNEVSPEDSTEEIKQVVAAWFGENADVMVGDGLDAENVARMVKIRLEKAQDK